MAWPEQRFAQFQTMLEAQDRVPEVVEVMGQHLFEIGRELHRRYPSGREMYLLMGCVWLRWSELEERERREDRSLEADWDLLKETMVLLRKWCRDWLRAGIDSPQKRVNLGVTPAKVKVRLRLEDFKVVAVLQTGTRTARALVTYTRRNGPGWAGREGKTWGGARRCGWRCSSR